MTTITIKIFIALLSRQRLTAKDLASRFLVSTKTIYRAINNLSTAGIPVYTLSGKNGGIFLEEHFDIRQFVRK